MRRYSCIQFTARSEYCCNRSAGIREDGSAGGSAPIGPEAAPAIPQHRTIANPHHCALSRVPNSKVPPRKCIKVVLQPQSAIHPNQEENNIFARSFYIRFPKITLHVRIRLPSTLWRDYNI